jgi:hypothetical protein
MAQQTFANLEALSSVRSKLNANATDAETRLTDIEDGITFVNVLSKTDFPAAVGGVITLAAGTAYIINGTVDLSGDRLETGGICALFGTSSETAFLTSTGLTAGVALITSTYTLPMQNLTIKDVDTAIDIGNTLSPEETVALDWDAVNFSNIPNIGTISDCDNWIYTNSAILSSQGLVFDGTVGTIGSSNSIFVGSGAAGSIISVSSTATISRRFRIIYSSIVAFGSTTGIDVDVSATVPNEGYILDTCNFSGGGTYTAGVAYTDDKARWIECRGVQNTTATGNMTMSGNSTATTGLTQSVPAKVAGTTSLNSISQKFSHSSNRLTYDGSLSREFQVTVVASLTSGNNKIIGLFVAKNGTTISESEMQTTTSGTGRSESITCQTILELATSDYVEIFCSNESGTQDVTVEYLNVIVKGI